MKRRGGFAQVKAFRAAARAYFSQGTELGDENGWLALWCATVLEWSLTHEPQEKSVPLPWGQFTAERVSYRTFARSKG